MKRLKMFNVVQLFIIILLAISNYFSYFYNEAYKGFIMSNIMAMKVFLIDLANKASKFIYWLLSQEYNFHFNNRELAIGIIFSAVLAWLLIESKTRGSALGVIKILFNKSFNKVYLQILTYTMFMIWILYNIGLWEFIYAKDTFVWGLFSATYLVYKVADDAGDNVFLDIIKGSFGITLIFEFLYNIYTFPLIIELIITLIMILLGLMIGVIEASPDKDEKVSKLINGIITYMTINIIIFIIGEVVINYKEFLSIQEFKGFLLPIIFNILFIPYLYYLTIWLRYDPMNRHLRMNKSANDWVRLYFRIKMFIHCKTDRKAIASLTKCKNHLIRNMETIEDVKEIFQ